MANPWDDPSLESAATKKIKERTARLRREGLNKPEPPAKKVGEIAAADAWAEGDALKRKRERIARAASPISDTFQKLKLK